MSARIARVLLVTVPALALAVALSGCGSSHEEELTKQLAEAKAAADQEAAARKAAERDAAALRAQARDAALAQFYAGESGEEEAAGPDDDAPADSGPPPDDDAPPANPDAPQPRIAGA